MTRRGATLLVAAVVLWALGRFFGVAELYVVAVATAALVAAGVAAVRLSTATIAVRRSLPRTRILSGTTGDVVLQLRNDARLPAALLLVEDATHHALGADARFVVPGLGPGRTTSLRYQLRGEVRGRFRVGPVRIRVRDPFGVAQRVRRYTATDEVVVYPKIERLADTGSRGAHRGSGASETRRLFNTGDEFYTMREYVTGDDLRQVHWPSTAHRQTLMVRQQEQPWQVEATVFVDLRAGGHGGVGPASSLEKAISVAASVIWHLADHGYTLRMLTESDSRLPGPQSWQVLLDRLAEATASRARALAPALQRLRSGGGEGLLVAVITPPDGDDPISRSADVRALLQAGRGYTARVAVVVEPGRARSRRAADTAALLRTAGWKSVSLRADEPFAERWATLTATTRHAAAYQPAAR